MNTQHYVAGFNASGRRVVTILCEYDPTDPSSEALLKADKEKAAKLASDATVIELIDQATFEQYMSNCVRDMSTGKPIPYVAPEPTAEEKAAAEKAKLASEYEANKNEMLTALQSATLAGNTDAVASIQQDYKDMTAAYKEAVEGVTTA
ncbi:hypothetical protein ACE418_01065 [Megasphaera sp. WILCCON 0056]|uniref:hypothetical protein n=1 Tax=Megasphaera sp. WILCCON 0056 TaxID=3345340 RepID=UPI003A811AB3